MMIPFWSWDGPGYWLLAFIYFGVALGHAIDVSVMKKHPKSIRTASQKLGFEIIVGVLWLPRAILCVPAALWAIIRGGRCDGCGARVKGDFCGRCGAEQ